MKHRGGLLAIGAMCVLIGCGGDKGRGSGSIDGTGAGTKPGTSTPGAVDAGAASGVDAGKPPVVASDAGTPGTPGTPDAGGPEPAKTPGSGPITTMPPARAVCVATEASFDLSRFPAVAPTDARFVAAWAEEARTTEVPGLALRFDGLDSGAVSATVGSVHALSAAEYGFDASPLAAKGIGVETDAASSRKLTIRGTTVAAAASFGSRLTRRGFQIGRVAFEGTLGDSCESMRGRVTLQIHGSSAGQSFGGTTVGAALGEPTTDIDGDGTADGWTVVLEGASREVPVEAPR